MLLRSLFTRSPRALHPAVQAVALALSGLLLLGPAQAGSKKPTERHAKATAVRLGSVPAPAARGAKRPPSATVKSRVGTRELAHRGKAARSSPARAQHGARAAVAAAGLARQRPLVEAEEAPVPSRSFGELAGLRATPDALDLRSSVALVIDQDTNEVLLRKNDSAVLPIASLTKLMTGLIISEARLPLDELITIEEVDIDTEKHSRSRLRVGTTLSRGELLHLALMSSENRAAHALGRTFPGGSSRFVSLMNARAIMLGMKDTRYVEPTGLSSANQSSAVDLATLVAAAYQDPLVRELSTSPGHELEVGHRVMQFNNTNQLVKNPGWEIGVQKTGYISEAGQCLVMQAKIAGRKLIMVFLDSAGKLSRIGDAERVRRWIESNHPAAAFPSVRMRSGPHAITG